MRLKLVILASLVAALLGAGIAIVLVLLMFSNLSSMSTTGPVVFAIYLLPVVTTLLAAMFVYRHTARRRKLQAALTTIIAFLLSLALFFVASLWSAPPKEMQPPPVTPAIALDIESSTAGLALAREACDTQTPMSLPNLLWPTSWAGIYSICPGVPLRSTPGFMLSPRYAG